MEPMKGSNQASPTPKRMIQMKTANTSSPVARFAYQATEIMTARLEALQNGDIKYNMANQFHESMLKSALLNVTTENSQEAYEVHQKQLSGDWFKPWDAMAYCNFYGTYDAPELDPGWTR